jgi:hypothetical protein
VTYVEWHERPKRTTYATVSKPDDLKARAKQFADGQEIEYPPDEHMTNVRVAGARRRRRL